MITSIHGILEATRSDHAIVRVGGFGIRVFAPASTLNRLAEIGTEVTFHTHFHVREDDLSLYGFSTEADRDAFEQLIGVSGVGPRVALAILSAMDASTFYQAIADEDQQRLGLARGVGKKLAAHLVLELKGKLPSLATLNGNTTGTMAAAPGKIQTEAIEALIGLGFSAAEAQTALAKVPPEHAATLEQQVTYALRTFSHQ
jgi:holliday junction DNA helicase RuvA